LDKNSGLHGHVNSRLNSQFNSQLNSQLNSGFHRTLNPNTIARGDEFSDIRGFFDAWLNVYKPGDPRYEEALATANKPESAKPWLQMLDSFRQSSDHSGFETIRKEIKKFFNIKVNPWETRPHAEQEQKQLGDYPHIVQKILDLWPSDDVVIYLERLLYNSRMSPREGFEITMFQQLESLLELANRADRPRNIQQLKRIGIADFLFVTPNTTNASSKAQSTSNTVALNTASVALKTEPAPQPKVTVAATSASSQPDISIKNDLVNNLEKNTLKEQTTATQQPTTPIAATVVSTSVPIHAPVQAPAQVQKAPSSTRAPVTLASESDEKSQFNANEVRLKLANAYLEIGDTEGACLLLEDVIKEAIPTQHAHAQRLLADIEKKQARICGDNEKIYFH
jgi:FimV-like protein